MKQNNRTYRQWIVCLGVIFASWTHLPVQAHSWMADNLKADTLTSALTTANDSLVTDSTAHRQALAAGAVEAPVDTARLMAVNDSLSKKLSLPKEKKRFIPDPKRATWLALLIPGGGQIYNRKYWKLPIVYGGFVGCAYALSWNNQMYEDYSQAYLDIMDDDPSTDSFKDFLPPNYPIEGNESRFQTIFQKKKDYYRRYRDLSVFCFIGVYILSVIDAYVDAELSNFDISKDLSLKVEPTVLNGNTPQSFKFDRHTGVGVQCSFSF